ncbi:UDP-N-acetyl-alpha-D-muramoyl-L-alanyl-L-glutamate epimerase [Pseudomarimonas arenosa]|uniref:UDP-N-acetyl-alpha-D-muramoyl-L-alanyl-L-glutamate epimerase n=1 Tax=Pseudomarimonas arenosa TaxID=2774145 RepID=A0AAW3ZN67_9GAMM|nr:UDP-N-acetyl-alpha-D-muramoyl-L-alanyl-L-glutamate epimerase [Pseudomarimonas arenosa]MBD8526072.1 endonuclease domain-containing protein [Pseudomarimonas arenosa]
MTEWQFERDQVECFRFVRSGIDPHSGEIALVYAFDQGPELVERLRLPGAPFQWSELQRLAVERSVQLLHWLAGVSYYKAAVPKQIQIESGEMDQHTADFLQQVYESGLGEFAYRNGLNLHGQIRFRPNAEVLAEAPALQLQDKALTAIGGGKDSLVSVETLRAAGVEQTLAWVGQAPLIRSCAERTELPTLQIERQLAPQLFEFNRRGAYNGHIPVTAINSAMLTVAALASGKRWVVFSNERSASYGSLIAGTGEVNHQWSKGWSFEQAFAAEARRRLAADLEYFSLLRPLSELAVARQFARTDRYDGHFSSCNRNFHILGERPASRWCGVCPKCRFVFLALAPFVSKPRLVGIFGRNLLDEPEQVAGFDALMEYQDHKPFECVGEGRESRAAMAALVESAVWREDALVARFRREILPKLDSAESDMSALLQPSTEHGIPAQIWSRVDARFRT